MIKNVAWIGGVCEASVSFCLDLETEALNREYRPIVRSPQFPRIAPGYAWCSIVLLKRLVRPARRFPQAERLYSFFATTSCRIIVQRQIRRQRLQLVVHLAESTQFPQLGHSDPGVPLFPGVERGRADPRAPQISLVVSPHCCARRVAMICSSVCPFGIPGPPFWILAEAFLSRFFRVRWYSFWVLGHPDHMDVPPLNRVNS